MKRITLMLRNYLWSVAGVMVVVSGDEEHVPASGTGGETSKPLLSPLPAVVSMSPALIGGVEFVLALNR